MKIVNVTLHALTFENIPNFPLEAWVGGEWETIDTWEENETVEVPPSGVVIDAFPMEKKIGVKGDGGTLT